MPQRVVAPPAPDVARARGIAESAAAANSVAALREIVLTQGALIEELLQRVARIESERSH